MGVYSGYRLTPSDFDHLKTVLLNKYLSNDFLNEHWEAVVEGLQLVVDYAKQVVNEPNTIATAVAHPQLTAINRAELMHKGVLVLPNTVAITAHFENGIITDKPLYYTIQKNGD